jgi:hypothetical protein
MPRTIPAAIDPRREEDTHVGGPAENTNEPWETIPDEYQQDLNPRGGAGYNVAGVGPQPMMSENVLTAYDIKNLHRRLEGYTDDELKRIPIVPEGSPLEQGATYINVRDVEPKEFTARAGMTAEPGKWLVPKSEVDYQLWNRLIGVENPERLGEA